MPRILSCLILGAALSSCNTSVSQRVQADTVKVGQKTESVINRTGQKIQEGGERLGHKIQSLGEIFEGNE